MSLNRTAYVFLFGFFSVTYSHAHFCCVYLCVTEEKRTAQSIQRKLWELLAPAGLTEDSGSSPWLHAYRRLLKEDGVDEEMQRRAVLMQLWATQVSQLVWDWHSVKTKPGFLTVIKSVS